MSGGMTMIGDMFNGYLKGRVDNLCSELARLIRNQPDLVRSGSFQSQSQNGSTQYNGSNGSGDGNSLFMPAPPDWWGADLRFPNSTGGQNGMRYAYFAQARRLAIDVGGQVTVYDTLDHSIGGVSQQSGGYGPQFSSQYGYLVPARKPPHPREDEGFSCTKILQKPALLTVSRPLPSYYRRFPTHLRAPIQANIA